MCGFVFTCSTEGPPHCPEELLCQIRKRGPDSFNIINRSTRSTSESSGQPNPPLSLNIHTTFVGSVLSLRGPAVISQPLEDSKTGSLLLWNGEAWALGNEEISGNDTSAVFRHLLKACSGEKYLTSTETAQSHAAAIRDSLQSIRGPYAFLFYDCAASCVFYGRDVLGRRSLLTHKINDCTLCVSSVSMGSTAGACEEVETGGFFMLKLTGQTWTSTQDSQGDPYFRPELIPWTTAEEVSYCPRSSFKYSILI